ncbi:MAG: hypothetical protein GY953_50105, partial [bacterium]|nr:hypothetical protein [bacterium]
EFSFSNPGARSLGFGGAFTALADDATAAFANPAGLVQLARPEVSIEGRSWSYTTPFTIGGRLFGPPTGIGLDTTPGLRTAASSTDLTGLSFLSFVFPEGNWALAFYRHQLANFEGSFETQGFFGTSPDSGRPFRFPDVRTISDFDIVTYAVSGAYRPKETFSLGFGFSYFDGKFSSRTDIFAPLGSTLPDGTFGLNSYAPAAIMRTATAFSSD